MAHRDATRAQQFEASDDLGAATERDALGAPSLGLSERAAYAGRWFNAWWEGYAFDGEAERRRIADNSARRRSLSGAGDRIGAIGESIWGAGRVDPGDPAWTMRHARMLGLAARARVALLGAGAGAPLRDLQAGARWRLVGYARRPVRRRGLKILSYDAAGARIAKPWADGALSFFELHRDPDQVAFSMFVAEQLKPGAPAAFVDFTGARKGVRLRSCFQDPLPGALRSVEETTETLERSGFRVSDVVDETSAFAALVTRGWARWKDAYRLAQAAKSDQERSHLMRTLGQYAHVWAERLDAMRGGQLQATRILVRRY